MKLFFKKYILLMSLLAVFVSIFQLDADDQVIDTNAGAQVSMMQLDKDSPRDAGDAVCTDLNIVEQPARLLLENHVHELNYQEPFLSIYPRPPIA